jgi:DNA-binding CsgD family transcriptional regulator
MRSSPYCMHMSLWVFSPVNAVNDALRRYVEGLGFDVASDPSKAQAALFDLTSVPPPLPPSPSLPSLALLASPDAVQEARRAGYLVHLSTDGEEHLRSTLAILVAGGAAGEHGAAGENGTVTDVGGVAAALTTEPAAASDAPQLTPREAQVMSLLMLGLTNKRIAKHLVITERTVKFHVASLMRKHGVSNRTKLMLKNPIVVTKLFSSAPVRRR